MIPFEEFLDRFLKDIILFTSSLIELRLLLVPIFILYKYFFYYLHKMLMLMFRRIAFQGCRLRILIGTTKKKLAILAFFYWESF